MMDPIKIVKELLENKKVTNLHVEFFDEDEQNQEYLFKIDVVKEYV